MKTLHDHLNDAIEKWVDFTGVDPEAKSWSILGDYEIKKTYDEIQEAQELDKTGLTTAMLLRSFADWLCKNVNFSLHELYHEPKEAREDLNKLSSLLDSLEADPIAESVKAFQNQLKKAVRFYNVDQDEVGELIEDVLSLAFIRRDAIKAVEKLSAYQFSRGDFSEGSFQYNPKIVQFWNINSLLDMMAGQPMPGVTLCLIRDSEQALFSYFAFAFRDGDNIIVLTDKEQEKYPGQNKKRRRPDRLFEKRAFQYRFPYQLLEYEVVNDKYIKVPEQEGLIERNTEAVPLGTFSDLDSDQILWLVMMLDLFRTRFWGEKKQLPETAYTGEMIERPKMLQAAMNLPVVQDDLIEMPWYTSEFVRSENVADEWEREPTGKNQWLEDRHEDEVDDDLLNLRGPENEVKALLKDKEVDEAFLTKWNQFDKQRKLKTLDPRSFGTEEQLQKDAKWTARYNKACQINRAARKEFEAKKDDVLRWWAAHVRENDDFLLNAAARMKFVSKRQESQGFGWTTKEGNIAEMYHNPNGKIYFYWTPWVEGTVKLATWSTEKDRYMCYVSGVGATVFCRIRPDTPQSVADVAGCDVEDMPVFLQHYWKNDQYSGNSILSRIDPMEYVVENPWAELDLKVIVVLGKRAFNRLRVDQGLDKFRDWKKLEKEK